MICTYCTWSVLTVVYGVSTVMFLVQRQFKSLKQPNTKIPIMQLQCYDSRTMPWYLFESVNILSSLHFWLFCSPGFYGHPWLTTKQSGLFPLCVFQDWPQPSGQQLRNAWLTKHLLQHFTKQLSMNNLLICK